MIKSKFLNGSFLVWFFLWAFLSILAYFDVGLNPEKIIAKLAAYTTAAAALFALQQYAARRHRWALPVLYTVQVFVVSIGITLNLPAFKYAMFGNEDQQVTAFIDTVGAKTDEFRNQQDNSGMFTDCQGVGSRIKKFRDSLVNAMLKRVPEKKWSLYRTRFDSAIVDPVKDMCAQSSRFAQLLIELSLLIRTKDIHAIDGFLQRYNFSPKARAIIIIGNQRINRGLLRDYIADMMQDFQPEFREIKPPGYVRANVQLQELSFLPS